MVNPKVSIIVPVFNVKTYLRECLDSVLTQSLSEIEVICGDGGSTDGSLEIIQEYAQKDSRVTYISKNGSGYGQSVNECMDLARGEYIGIVESDDAVKPETYEILYRTAKENDLDWVRADIYFYYSGMPEGQQLERESIIYDGDFYNTVLNPQADYRPYKSGLRTWSGIYKTEFLNHNGIRHHETPGGSYQDVGFYLKTLYYARRVSFIDQAFYMWRQDNPGSSVHYNSAKLVEKSLAEWRLNQEYLDSHPELGKHAIASYHYRKFFSYLWTIDMAVGEDQDIVIKVAEKEFTSALEKGEIDKGFFEEWEWQRFMETLQNWKTHIQQKAAPAQVAEKKSHSLTVKQKLKHIARPFANILQKIMYKLMRNVIFTFENNINMLRIRVNETAEDTQWQVRESTAELQTAVRSVESFLERLHESVSQHEELVRKLEERMTEIETRNAAQIGKIHASISELCQVGEEIKGQLAEASKKILDQGDQLLVENVAQINAANTSMTELRQVGEEIKGQFAEAFRKILDQGDILWGVKSRTEDIHGKIAEVLQKVLDQGDVLWSARDKIKDVEVFAKKNADAQMWNLLFETKRDELKKLISTSPTYDSAFYWNNRYGSINSAQRILSVVFTMVPHKSVIDFGCGTGTWLWVAQALGTTEVHGVDGDYVPRALLLIPEGDFQPADLQEPVLLDHTYDLAISMEVAEHLSAESADVFVDSLCRSADTVLFSAAQPGQGGDGHINEQPTEYWVEKFAHRGFDLKEIKHLFRCDEKIEPWYRENVLLFQKT